MERTTKLTQLVALLKEAPDGVYIQPHNVPDPDAIASSAGLKYLLAQFGVKAVIVYDREIEKIDSVRMLELFGIEMVRAGTVGSLDAEDWAVLVDGQKGAGNLTDLATAEVAVIDHHELADEQEYRFADIRPQVGSCATIIAEYFFDNAVMIPTKLASALLFGIMKDTDSLTRVVSDLDIDMFYRLYRLADMSLIKELNGNQLTLEDLRQYAEAFKTVEICHDVGLMRLDSRDDSLLGAASDIVLSLNGVVAVVAYSVRANGIRLSVRSETPAIKANALVRFIVGTAGIGGGHDHMAGGFMAMPELPPGKTLAAYLRERSIEFVTGG